MAFTDMTDPHDEDHDDSVKTPGSNSQGSNAQGSPTQSSNPPTPQSGPPNTPPQSGPPHGIMISLSSGIPGHSHNDDDDDVVAKYLINYNERFGTAPAALFRDNVIDQTISVLMSKSKPNALLVGAAGVGKTHIVEDIARRIVAGDVPDQLRDYTVYELPLSSLVSGASLVGQMEERLEEIIAFASNIDNKAILFIDEIHQLTKNNDNVMGKVSQMLKPALARGDLHVIGATTSQEVRELNNDPAFKRRFSQLIVSELTPDQTAHVLKHIVPYYIAHYRGVVDVPIPNDTDGVIESIVRFADEYNRAKNHRPDNAITLMDKSMSHIALMYQKLQKDGIAPQQGLPLNDSIVERIAKQLMTGHIDEMRVDFDQLAENLSLIKGQDHVIEKVTRLIKGRQLGAFPHKTPASWLFAGASGVGKTKVAEIIAETLTRTTPIMLNMAEYHSPASINRIIGSPDGYVGSDSHREKPLDSLESNPYQVIVLDEFEKAHRDVQNIFLSAFDKGVIDTATGKVIDLSKAIVIATTNAGRDDFGKSSLGFAQRSRDGSQAATLTSDQIASKLANAFPKELIARFSYVTAFNRIDRDTYTLCLTEHYEREYTRLCHQRPTLAQYLPEHLDDDTVTEIVDASYVPDHGVRPARRAVENWITEMLIDTL